MMDYQVYVNNDKLIYKYSQRFDVLDIYLTDKSKIISDEISDGIYEHFDIVTDNFVGVSIEDYKKRDKEYLKKLLPISLSFDYIDKNIVN